MLGRVASRMLTSLAVLCATLAWAGWVFLHTIGDAERSGEIATAVLEDDAAREQVATVFALQLVRATGIDRSNIDVVESAVSAALDDPRLSTEVVDAFGSAHSSALGVDDGSDTSIDPNAMLAAVRDQVALVSPELAAQLPDGSLPVVELPEFHPPGIATARRVAESVTTALALAAAVLAAVALGFGDRRSVLRRIGVWGVLSGIGWVLLPLAVVAGARAWASDVDAIVEAAVRTSVDGIMPVAVALFAGGAVALVLSFIPALWPERRAATAGAPHAARSGAAQRSAPAVRAHPAGHQPAHQAVPAATAVGAAAAADARGHTARVDTWVPSAGGVAAAPPAQPSRPATAASMWPGGAPAAPPAAPPRSPAADEVDPWASYFGPESSR